MNGLLSGKTTIVAGGYSKIVVGIVQSFLNEDATVIVTASSSIQIDKLISDVKNIETGNLITALIDDGDFERITEFASNIKERFGNIDLVIAAHGSDLPAVPLSEIKISDWQEAMVEFIGSNFIVARTSLQLMKEQRYGTFIVISDPDIFYNKRLSPIGRLASACLFELSLIFSEEVKSFNVNYYHLFSGGKTPPLYQTEDGVNAVSPEQIGNFIIQLFSGNKNHSSHLFQNLLIWPWDISNELMDKE